MNVLILFTLVSLSSSYRSLGMIRTPAIQTKLGPVQGAVLSTVWNSIKYSSFKGIPFATPPVGRLRFKPPVPPTPWNATRAAIEEPESCPQVFLGDFHYMGNEDCLYLSVFTPETNFNRNMTPRAVMVWMYGGSFVSGFINTTYYGPDFFIEKDVIIVSINYRVGALGFLNLNHPDALGNAGLKDQTMALRWIQENIAAFGGDPGRVTIFGGSAGATSVTLHLLSEHSRGLFHRIIAQSGTPMFPLYSSPELALNNAVRLASTLGFTSQNPAEILEFLLRAPAQDIVQKTETMGVATAYVTLPFAPTTENNRLAAPEDIFLSECPIKVLESEKFHKYDVMLGFAKDEYITFLPFVYRILDRFAKIWNTLFEYIPFIPEYWYGPLNELLTIGQEFVFKAPIDLTRELIEQNNDGHPIYFYQISYSSPYAFHHMANVSIEGASHYDDVSFIFNMEILHAPTDPKHPYNQFRSKVVTLWTNFAKYGNPTPQGDKELGGVIWEPSGKDGRVFNISETFDMMNRNDVITERILLIQKLVYSIAHYISGCS
ncbi:juvenile hormone esterase-like isoform X2 [Colletes gigas]|uniref:juvenile hormone esterase-like isoform X2 n=1 Tax=Colletes gigas TaxID=935657 RepID=UPI001C9B6D89|nr:juvenile hormone esterase-like isoform X2 [Colletes gigas]